MNRVSLSFKDLSKKIVDELPHLADGNYRTALSRLYYSIFLELREVYKKKLPIESIYRSMLMEENPLIHALLREATFYLSKDIGRKLQDLHELRKVSDYDIRKVVSKEGYENGLSYYQSLLEFVKKIKGFKPERIEKAFEFAFKKIESRRKQKRN